MPYRSIVLVITLLAVGCHRPPAAQGTGDPVVVVAARSLQSALGGLGAAPVRPEIGYAGVPGLEHKIAASPLPDVVIADAASIDKLIAAAKLDASTRRTLGSDKLVIVAQLKTPIPLNGAADLARIGAEGPPWRGRLAVLDPVSWPEGALTRSTLEAMQDDGHPVWDAIKDRVQLVRDPEELAHAIHEHERMLGITGSSAAPSLGDGIEAKCDLGASVTYAAAATRGAPHAAAARLYISWLAGQRGFPGGESGK